MCTAVTATHRPVNHPMQACCSSSASRNPTQPDKLMMPVRPHKPAQCLMAHSFLAASPLATPDPYQGQGLAPKSLNPGPEIQPSHLAPWTSTGWVLSGTPPRSQAVSRDCRVAEGSLKLHHSCTSAAQALHPSWCMRAVTLPGLSCLGFRVLGLGACRTRIPPEGQDRGWLAGAPALA